jgi:hypothetical protein
MAPHALRSQNRRANSASSIRAPVAAVDRCAGSARLVLFEVSGWGDAAGHAPLFNGSACYDHCYFNETGVTYRTTKANFWALP